MKQARTLQMSLLVAIGLMLASASGDGQAIRPRQGMGGASDTARNYSSRRTVGIVDPRAPVVFEDITTRTALAGFKHRSGGASKDYILEAPSGGVAIFDYDGDGRPDVYL